MGNCLGYDSPVTSACRLCGSNPLCRSNPQKEMLDAYNIPNLQQPSRKDYQLIGVDQGVDHPPHIHMVAVRESTDDSFVYCPVELNHDWKP